MIINGIDENEFIKGWWGGKGEGKELLRTLNLPRNRLPFDVHEYLLNGVAKITTNGKLWTLTCCKYDGVFEFSLLKHDKPKTIKLYREWNGESLDMILQLESYAIGEYTRFALNGKVPKIDDI